MQAATAPALPESRPKSVLSSNHLSVGRQADLSESVRKGQDLTGCSHRFEVTVTVVSATNPVAAKVNGSVEKGESDVRTQEESSGGGKDNKKGQAGGEEDQQEGRLPKEA